MRRDICDTRPTKKYKASCTSVVRRLRRDGATILRWGCSQGFFGDEFYIEVPYGKRPDVSKYRNFPTIYTDRDSMAKALKKKTGFSWFAITCEEYGLPVFDFDGESGFLIVPETAETYKRGQQRVFLSNPRPIDDFVSKVKRIVNKHHIDTSKYQLRTVFTGEDENLFDGMIIKMKD